MPVKRKLFPSAPTQAKRLKQLERKVAQNKTEVRIDSSVFSCSLRAPGGGSGLNGFLNNPSINNSAEQDGRNFKTVSIRARLSMDATLLSADNYRYRMILFSNENDSGRDATQVEGGDGFPGPYDDAVDQASLNFFIDNKKFMIYDDKTISPRSQALAGSPQNQLGYGSIEVGKAFRVPKLVRYPSEFPTNPTHGCIGLAVWRQSLSTGVVERVLADSTDAPLIISEHKWIDP